MKEYCLTELGYFSERDCKTIKQIVEAHPTFMNFKVSWSNCAGNCTLIAKTDYNESEEEIKRFFVSSLVSGFIDTIRIFQANLGV